MSTAAAERGRAGAARSPAAPEALRRHVAGLLGAYRPGFALPGPIASSEHMVELFHTWYTERLRALLGL